MYLFEPNRITIAHSELEPSPNLHLTRFSNTAVRQLKCKWADSITLARELLGWTDLVSNNVITHKPHLCPGLVNVLAQEVDVKGFGKIVDSPADTKVAEYIEALLTVHYSTPEFEEPETSSEVYITESLESAAEFITMNYQGLYWDTDAEEPLQAGEAPAKLIRMLEWTYTLHRLPELPTVLLDRVGMVNSKAHTSRKYSRTFGEETLLLGNPTFRRETTIKGTFLQSVTLRLLNRPQGWNTFPRPSKISGNTIEFSTIKDEDGDEVSIYEPADMSTLLLV